ncbi:MAG: hypothetical protein LBS69_10025 [Prevotellaceae bacterium]|jgi:hypothetical protein|nr:hypothetical protein [Prevotellaceae bacterium]
MDFSCIDIGFLSLTFFQNNNRLSFKEINNTLKDNTGIVNFFEKEEYFVQLKETLINSQSIVAESQVEYGDYQTNQQLSQSICNCR